jgi:hypothetical protein
MKIETHDISLSSEQLDQMLEPLQQIMQNMLSACKAKAVKKIPDSRNILLVDESNERVQYLAHLLVKSGYRPLVMANGLEAFTRFLQVPFVPFTIILAQDDVSNRLFLQRLLQQIMQKYEWEIPLIRLHFQSTPLAPQHFATSPVQPQQALPNQALPAFPRDVSILDQRIATPPQWPSAPSTPPTPPTPPPVSQPHILSTPRSETRIPSQSFNMPGTSTPSYSAALEANKKVEKEAPHISLEGQSIGRYQIQMPLGNSGKSNVYKTYDRLREQEIAFKALQTDALPYNLIERTLEEIHLFQQESDLLHGFDHPHIAPVWSSGKSYISGVSFIYKTMPCYQEGSLAQWLFKRKGEKTFTARDVVPIVLQLADALQYLHNRQVTFQNFKLSNVLVSKSAKNTSQLHLMLADFAIPQDGSFFPKSPDALSYIAPERWDGQVSPATDQYGLAVIVYELLTGRLPFQGSSEHVMKLLHTGMQVQPPRTLNPTLSASVDNILLKALSKRPEDRFTSVDLFAKTFQRYCL